MTDLWEKRTVRKLLGDLNDSQSTTEATFYADKIVARAKEDISSISEYTSCGHVDWDELLSQKMKEAGWVEGKLWSRLHLV